VRRRWSSSRFDDTPEDPQTSLVNLVDIMLVFICGLIVALVSAQPGMTANTRQQDSNAKQHVVTQGRELAELPEGLRGNSAGNGMQPVGQVYRDPRTGKLILVGE
jgi:hypothetical protein